MTLGRIAIITKRKHFSFLNDCLPTAELHEECPSGEGEYLVCFGTGLVVPKSVLDRWNFKLNFHGGPTFHPGRDPHHWAAYMHSGSYGATLHEMYSKVDAGPIYAQVLFGVNSNLTPADYLHLGMIAMKSLFECWSARPLIYNTNATLKWSGVRKSRSDLIQMCDFRGLEDAEKANRRMAFAGFENFFIEDK